jgi:hypothetical protein
MFKLNKKILVPDITSALEQEDGAFLISAPTGETLEVRVEAGYVKIERSTYLEDAKRNDLLWTIVKIGELS